jgi:hypothetical protein
MRTTLDIADDELFVAKKSRATRQEDAGTDCQRIDAPWPVYGFIAW